MLTSVLLNISAPALYFVSAMQFVKLVEVIVTTFSDESLILTPGASCPVML